MKVLVSGFHSSPSKTSSLYTNISEHFTVQFNHKQISELLIITTRPTPIFFFYFALLPKV